MPKDRQNPLDHTDEPLRHIDAAVEEHLPPEMRAQAEAIRQSPEAQGVQALIARDLEGRPTVERDPRAHLNSGAHVDINLPSTGFIDALSAAQGRVGMNEANAERRISKEVTEEAAARLKASSPESVAASKPIGPRGVAE